MTHKDLPVNIDAQEIIHEAIVAPNFTQIPNVIFDYWMSRLSPGAFKILICMSRKIFGWHKTTDTISKNQLMKATGMSKNSVQSAIEELQKHSLILKYQHTSEYGCHPNTYSLNIHKPKDELYQDPDPGQILGGVGQNLTGGRSKFDPTKERPSKERPSKEKTTSSKVSQKESASRSADKSAGQDFSDSPQVPEKKKMPACDFVPEAKEIVEKMVSALREANKDWRPPKNLYQMMLHVHEMITVDGHSPKRILQVYMYAVDSFWTPHLSGNKTNPAKYLREKFATIGPQSDLKPSTQNKVDRRLRDKEGEVVDQYKDMMF